MMTDSNSSRVFLNPDGYLEMILVGRVEVAKMRELTDQAIALISEHGPIGGLIDGRQGNIVRTVESLRILQKIQMPGLVRLVILTAPDNPVAIRKPSIVMSMLTTILGFRPMYLSDESEARALVARQPR
jgi:hypothetical protein